MTALSFLVDVFFAAFYTRFALIHAPLVMAGQWYVAPFVIQETMLAVLFLARRRTRAVSVTPWDWFVAGVGTFSPLLIHGGNTGSELAIVFQVVGLSGSIWSLAYLGRSFGIVPAHRGICTEGPYAYVRHPMYAAHMLTLLGFLGAYSTQRNATIVAATMLALVARTYTEEALLKDDVKYLLYTYNVPWRLIPGVF